MGKKKEQNKSGLQATSLNEVSNFFLFFLCWLYLSQSVEQFFLFTQDINKILLQLGIVSIVN